MASLSHSDYSYDGHDPHTRQDNPSSENSEGEIICIAFALITGSTCGERKDITTRN